MCVHNPVNCLSVILFTSHSNFFVFWERDITSEHHVSRFISSSLFTRSFTFLLLLSIAIIIPCVLPFLNNKTGEIDNLSELHWEQSYRVCVQVRVSCTADTYLSSPESY